jgi:hypothetical protein
VPTGTQENDMTATGLQLLISDRYRVLVKDDEV